MQILQRTDCYLHVHSLNKAPHFCLVYIPAED